MTDPVQEVLGFVLTRLTLVGATLVCLWALWNELYVPAAALLLSIGYLFYLLWRSTQANEPIAE